MQRLREGRNPGFRLPYGLRTGETPGAFAAVPEEVAVVQRIFGLYARGLGYKAIAMALSRESIRFRGGRPWSAQTVAAVLRNPLYAGRLVYGQVAVDSPRVPPVIDPGAFAEVQSLRTRRAQERTPARAASSSHLLTGLLRCRRCGAAMMGRKRYGRGDSALYYICTGQRARGTAYCDCGYIRQDLLDAHVLGLLVARYGGLVGRERYQAEAAEQRNLLVAALAESERELAGLERELAVIGRDYRQERLSAEAFAEQRAVVTAEQARAGARASWATAGGAFQQE
jgi:site-specific DNA recombinase